MTDGNDEPEASDEDAGSDDTTELSSDTLDARLDDAAERLEAAETESDLDDVEADVDAIAADVEAADLPEPDEDDEDGEDPRADLEDRISDIRADIEAARGPYAEDVASAVEAAASDVESEQWTPEGFDDVVAALESFTDVVENELGTAIDVTADRPAFEDEPYVDGAALESLRASFDDAAETVTGAGLDPDEDAETIATLLQAAETLQDDVESATNWSDLSVRQQLDAHGYYDVLDHRKDFPPEWGALKVWTKRDRADMVLLALDTFDSDFMEDHALDALRRLAPEEALEPMMDMAQKRNKDAIEILGKIGSDEPVEMLLEYTDQQSDPLLQKTTLKALGEIGSADATQAAADQLTADDEDVRSQAARALGMLGDTRAIDPLADALADDDDDTVRASAAWALNQIGTERALEVLVDYADDRAFGVQTEAEKAV